MSEVTYTQKRDYNEQFRKQTENARRRASEMCVKVFQLKIQENKCNETQRKFLEKIFVEAKWYYNDCIAFGKEREETSLGKMTVRKN